MEQTGLGDKPQTAGVTLKAVAVGLLLIPLNCYWIMCVEGAWHTGHPTCISLFWNVIFSLVVLILINLALKKLCPRAAFNQGEMITVYAMLCIASGLAGHDCMQLLIPVLSIPFYYAEPGFTWETSWHPHLPEWLTVRDPEVLKGYYEQGGTSLLYTKLHFWTWFWPSLWVAVFITALALVMICINVLMRKEWTDNEKLSYPIIRLPLAMTEHGGTSAFFTNRLLWLGIALAAGLDILNGLHQYYPWIPNLAVRHNERNISYLFSGSVWESMGWVPLPFYPFIIALGFFLPVDLSFSIWFFYWFRKTQQLMGGVFGWNLIKDYPFTSSQSWGAWIALTCFALWLARFHLRDVALTVLRGAPLRLLARILPSPALAGRLRERSDNAPIDDSDEPMRYRSAAAGTLIGAAILFAFCHQMGLSWWVFILFFGLFYVLSIAITRMRAELGPPAHEMAFMMNSAGLMMNTVGAPRIGAGNMALFPFFWFFTGRGYRNHVMPHQLEAFAMAQRSRISVRRLGLVMVAAAFLGAMASFWAHLHATYHLGHHGGDAIAHSSWICWSVPAWIDRPEDYDTNWWQIGAMVFGFIFTLFNMFIRTRLTGWPFHPAGYALSMNYGVDYFWSCLVIATGIKFVVLKYFGLKTYRQLIPFAFGVIIGEYAVGAFWSVFSVISESGVYDFAPG